MRKILIILSICACNILVKAQQNQQKSLQQLQSDFVDLRFGVMMHFNMGTFTDEEWANPNQDPQKFDPKKLDCNQWAKACKSAGMTYGILTTKHHDGFCLWDSKYTEYDIGNSPAKRDVVAEYVKAFRSQGLKPCLYFSMWDRHNGIENGGTKQEEFVMNQLTELLTNYGEIPLIIFDGWNWKMGHKAISYQRIYDHVKKLQPNCLISEHNGNGVLQTDIIYYEGPKGVYPLGNNIYASQMALTLTNGWFWHPSSPKNVKSVNFTLDKLQRVVPLYCNYMINIGPNRDGLFDEEVVAHLKAIGKLWKPSQRQALPQQLPVPRSYLEIKNITSSAGKAFIEPEGPAKTGSPISALLNQNTASVTIDGVSDLVGDRGGFAAFQTYWKFAPEKERYLILDLGTEKTFSKFYYLPTQLKGYSGIITQYQLFVSTDNQNFREITNDSWRKTTDLKITSFPAVSARYVKLQILTSVEDATISEVGVGN
ncbi:O-GlcNAcase NagJ precursor [compost metagenome]|uniref:alpha-L-fucosidase n=1 Tax=Pedobacter ghigonis TaxID=2730403 RepID=UPI000FB93864|nr:alpha-L-fucosidase [Pedobacter ghigonis]